MLRTSRPPSIASMDAAGVQMFVGRGNEMSVASALIDPIRGGSGHCLVVEGEAGIGKSRFVEELLAVASRSGFDVYRGTARELEKDVPFGPVLQAIDVVERSVEGVLDVLEGLCEKGPVVIAIEDVH